MIIKYNFPDMIVEIQHQDFSWIKSNFNIGGSYRINVGNEIWTKWFKYIEMTEDGTEVWVEYEEEI